MKLDIEPPAPPDIVARSGAADYEYEGAGDARRAALQGYLEEGAWDEAFEEWTEDPEMTEADVEIARDLDLFSRFDFSCDGSAQRVRYREPTIPEEWHDLHPGLDSWGQVSTINGGLDELGQVTAEILQTYYVDWEGSDAFGEQYNAGDESGARDDF